MLLTGQTYTVSDDYGKYLVSLGAVDTDGVIASRAFAAIDQVVSDDARAVRSLVSEVGNITATDLLTTTGTTGQVVRLSDGDDQGAILMWSTPSGATAETWCWWLWPQASYL
jgi:hypothetical protein